MRHSHWRRSSLSTLNTKNCWEKTTTKWEFGECWLPETWPRCQAVGGLHCAATVVSTAGTASTQLSFQIEGGGDALKSIGYLTVKPGRSKIRAQSFTSTLEKRTRIFDPTWQRIVLSATISSLDEKLRVSCWNVIRFLGTLRKNYSSQWRAAYFC